MVIVDRISCKFSKKWSNYLIYWRENGTFLWRPSVFKGDQRFAIVQLLFLSNVSKLSLMR